MDISHFLSLYLTVTSRIEEVPIQHYVDALLLGYKNHLNMEALKLIISTYFRHLLKAYKCTSIYLFFIVELSPSP